MHVKRLAASIVLAGACAAESVAAVSPAYASTRPSTTQSSPATAPHWASVGFYYTYTACAADGAYLVANDPNYGGWRCLFVSDEDLWHLEVYVGPS